MPDLVWNETLPEQFWLNSYISKQNLSFVTFLLQPSWSITKLPLIFFSKSSSGFFFSIPNILTVKGCQSWIKRLSWVWHDSSLKIKTTGQFLSSDTSQMPQWWQQDFTCGNESKTSALPACLESILRVLQRKCSEEIRIVFNLTNND